MTYFLWYLLYPPLYLAGPLATYNGAVSALEKPQQATPWRSWFIYVARWFGANAFAV